MMRRAWALPVVAFLAGCAVFGSDSANPKADLGEAARINAQMGLDYMRKGDLRLAEEKLKRAVSQDSRLSLAHTGLGILYSRKGRDDEAEDSFRRALSLEPGNPDAINNYGTFLCSKGKTDKAEEMFVKAAKDADYVRPELAWTNAGVCVRATNPEKAESYFREALKANDKFPDALAQFALLSFDKGDYMRARAFLQRYEAVGAPSPSTLWLRSKTEAALGDETTARLYESRLRTQFPEADIPAVSGKASQK
jgi:type IV pilus assembly protein PilF